MATYGMQADGTTVIKNTKKNTKSKAAQAKEMGLKDYMNPLGSLTDTSAIEPGTPAPYAKKPVTPAAATSNEMSLDYIPGKKAPAPTTNELQQVGGDYRQTWASADQKRKLFVSKPLGKYKYIGSDGKTYEGTLGDNVNWEKEIQKKAAEASLNKAGLGKGPIAPAPQGKIQTGLPDFAGDAKKKMEAAVKKSATPKSANGWTQTWTGKDGRYLMENKSTGEYAYKASDGGIYRGRIGDKRDIEAEIAAKKGKVISNDKKNVPSAAKSEFDPNQKWTAPGEAAKKSKIITDITDPDMINLDDESLMKSKQAIAKTARDRELANIEAQKKGGIDVLAKNKASLDALYGKFKKESEDDFKAYEKEQNDLFAGYEGTRLRNAQGMARTLLARTGMSTKQLTPEALLQLSDEIGSKSLNDIYEAKVKKTDLIRTKKDAMLTYAKQLEEKGTLSANEYNAKVQEINDKANSAIAQINNSYINTVFGIVDTGNAAKKANQTNVMNMITNFGAQVGLKGNMLGLLQAYMDRGYSSPQAALSGMLKDIGNPRSPLSKASASIQKQLEDAAKQAALLEAAKVGAKDMPSEAIQLATAQWLATKKGINKNYKDITSEDVSNLNADEQFQSYMKDKLPAYMSGF